MLSSLVCMCQLICFAGAGSRAIDNFEKEKKDKYFQVNTMNAQMHV